MKALEPFLNRKYFSFKKGLRSMIGNDAVHDGARLSIETIYSRSEDTLV